MTVFLVERCAEWECPLLLGVYADRASAEKGIKEDIRFMSEEYGWDDFDDAYHIEETDVIKM